MGWTVRDRIPVGTRFFTPAQINTGAYPASCTIDTGSFPSPLLVPRSKNQSRTIPILSLRTFVACNRCETYLYFNCFNAFCFTLFTGHEGLLEYERYSSTLFLDLGTRREWEISVTSRPLSTPGKVPLPIVQDAGLAPWPVWTGAENLTPTGLMHLHLSIYVFLRFIFILNTVMFWTPISSISISITFVNNSTTKCLHLKHLIPLHYVSCTGKRLMWFCAVLLWLISWLWFLTERNM
jgi:hypothetical protein